MSYKNATIALACVLAATYVLLLVFFFVSLLPQLKMGASMNRAVGRAADNDTMCSTVPCDFVPDPAPVAPSDAELAAADGKYNLVTSKYAAQAVATLEDAALNGKAPQPLPGARLLALISGQETGGSGKDGKGRMRNMVAIMQPVERVKQVYIAIRGTQTEEEWKIDWDMSLVPLRGQRDVLVHKGFLDAVGELMPGIMQALGPILQGAPDTHVVVSGHSLGASLAALCTLALVQAGLQNVHTYVYAPPRVGNDNFVKLVLQQRGQQLREFHAIANVADLIPQVPLSVMPNVKDPDKPLLYAQFPLLMFQDNWGSWIHNHVMPVYIANLANVAPVSANLGVKKPVGLAYQKPTKLRVPPGFTHSLAKKILFT